MSRSDKNLYALAALRVGLGYIFLWAFFDKLIGLGFATCKGESLACAKSWAEGGSPTAGFLGNAVSGPLTNFYQGLSGQAWVDWMFMLGLLFVGLGLVLGAWIKTAAAAGIAMMLLLWSSLLWPEHTPGVDEHIIYGLVLLYLLTYSGPYKFSFKPSWLKLP